MRKISASESLPDPHHPYAKTADALRVQERALTNNTPQLVSPTGLDGYCGVRLRIPSCFKFSEQAG